SRLGGAGRDSTVVANGFASTVSFSLRGSGKGSTDVGNGFSASVRFSLGVSGKGFNRRRERIRFDGLFLAWGEREGRDRRWERIFGVG
ncbi:MAG: hypothetical protein J6K25_04395, partial [Thermoguttaceae bacterium]|nr:hypothetical protein [Thermoguttaceae bacterium]